MTDNLIAEFIARLPPQLEIKMLKITSTCVPAEHNIFTGVFCCTAKVRKIVMTFSMT